MTWRRRLPELLLACGAVLAFLALLAGLELALRLARPDYLDRTRVPTIYSEHYGWVGAPSCAIAPWFTRRPM